MGLCYVGVIVGCVFVSCCFGFFGEDNIVGFKEELGYFYWWVY